MRIRPFLILAFLAFPLLLQGQSAIPIQLNFSRQNDFTWFSSLDFQRNFTKGKYSLEAFVHQDQIYNSSLSDNRFVQLYINSSLWHYFALSKKIDLAGWTETDQYLSTRNEKISAYAGIRLRPVSFLSITPLIGFAWDKRSGLQDQGFSPALRADLQKDFSDGLSYSARALFRYKNIEPRRQYNAFLDQQLSKDFGGYATLVAGLKGVSTELDDYSGQMVKRILSDTLAPYLAIQYKFSPKVIWESDNRFNLSRRRFLFDVLEGGQLSENNLSFRGLEFDLLQRLSLNLGKIRLNSSYEFLYTSRNYELENNLDLNPNEFQHQVEREKEKDFLKKLHKVDATAEWLFSKRHSFTGKFGSQYIQYDTPSDLNFDDRDELTYLGGFEWGTNWRRNFRTSIGLSGNYRHYAFLFAEKSQDNYIQRSLRSEFKFRWTPMRSLTLEGTQAVYVTYNVKDFSDFRQTDRSTRNLETNFKANWQPFQRLTGKLAINRKEMQQSYLNWEAFSETTLDTTGYLTIENSWRYIPGNPNSQNAWYLESGYKHFAQIRRQPALMTGIDQLLYSISLKQVVLRTGPLLGFGLKTKNGSQLEAVLWLQFQVKKYDYKVLSEPGLAGQSYREDELNQVETELEPYPNLSLQYRF